MMMGGGLNIRTGAGIRPATTLGLSRYLGPQSGTGNRKETAVSGAAKKKKKTELALLATYQKGLSGKSKSSNSVPALLDVRTGQSPKPVIRKKSQDGGGRPGPGGGRSGTGGGRGGVVGSSVTLSRQAPGSSEIAGGSGKGSGTSLEVGQDCGFSGKRVCSGLCQDTRNYFLDKILLIKSNFLCQEVSSNPFSLGLSKSVSTET